MCARKDTCIMSMTQQKHPFHLVDPSPWPIFASLGAFSTTFGGVMFFHGYTGGESMVTLGMTMIMYSMYVWWRDVIREATFEGHHTATVQLGLRYGMLLFIVSEVMLEPIIEQNTNSEYVGLLLKGVIALLLKPIDLLVEWLLMRKTLNKMRSFELIT